MQRLFTMFPTGLPGAGLILLRLGVAIAATSCAAGGLWDGRHIVVAALVAGLIVGVLTPVCATLAVAWAAWLLFSGGFCFVAILSLLNALALALIGPGAYSIDARLFGRRLLVHGSPPRRS